MAHSLTHPTILQPVAAQERCELIDILRGFALFGVLWANLVFNTIFSTTPQSLGHLPTMALEPLALKTIRFLVMGKFIFLFSLLFGLGLSIQMERARERGVELGSVYLRRLGVLLLFGLGHGIFLWFGDILHYYAVIGVILFLLRKGSDRTLLAVGAILAYVPVTLLWHLGPALLGSSARGDRAAWVAERVAGLTQGGYGALVQDNLTMYLHITPPRILVGYTGYLGGLFLLGFVLGRHRVLQEAHRYLPAFRRLLVWGLVIGLPGNLLYTLTRRMDPESPWFIPLRSPTVLSIAALSLAYLAALVLLYHNPRGRRLLAPLAPVGRMALTHYLIHSICFVLLFSGVGLGLAGKIGPFLTLPIALAVFAFQVAVSPVWLRHFRFGPTEWLWRSLTYGRRPAFRVQPGKTPYRSTNKPART